MVAKAFLVLLVLAAGAFAALLFLGGSIQPILPPVGPAIDPPGSVHVSLPMDRDVSCPEEDPEDCAPPTPIPTIDPAAAADARPLVIPSIDVPIDHVGTYVVPVGEAVLPNGVLTQADATLVDEMRLDLEIRNHAVGLRVTGEDGAYRGNAWSDGWHEGTETVAVTLEFEVLRLDAPTTLELREIIVR